MTISGVGEGDTSTDLGVLVSDGGFFPQAFGQSPDPTQQTAPDRLGPRYLVTYTVPGPDMSTLEQDLYPYAAGGAVTYMRPGQRFWDTQTTPGGWYRGTVRLKQMLVQAGLPKSAFTTRGRAAISRTRQIAIGAGAGVALAAAFLAFYRRRR